MGMGEKTRNTNKRKSETKEKIPRLVALPSPRLRNGGRLFSGVRKHRKQARPTLGGRGGPNLVGQEILTWGGVPKDPYRRRHGQAEERRMTVFQCPKTPKTSRTYPRWERGPSLVGIEILIRGGVPKDPYRRRHGQVEEGRMTPTLPHFVRPGSLPSPTFC